MYYSKSILEMQGVEILKDIDKNGKERPWRPNKLGSLSVADTYERLGKIDKAYLGKAYRIRNCGTYLEYLQRKENKDLVRGKNSLRLKDANFCRERLCVMCGWRRSKKIYAQVSKVMNKALENKEYKFIFLTLTCKNVEGSEMSGNIDNMFYAFNKLFKRKQVEKAVKGWFRALEVTHNLEKESLSYDTYHPHFHIILMVNKSYFNKPEQYLSQANWTNLWQESLEVDYIPIVNVKTFKTINNKAIEKSIAEAAKYTVKSNDYIVRLENGEIDEQMTDASVLILDRALKGRRLVAFGGELRKIQKELKLDDLEKGNLIKNNDDDELREDVGTMIVRYGWHVGLKQYYKIK
jgi:plasmid rolling circle replication initiator protein Rep